MDGLRIIRVCISRKIVAIVICHLYKLPSIIRTYLMQSGWRALRNFIGFYPSPLRYAAKLSHGAYLLFPLIWRNPVHLM